jgi:D-glycero-beta-D-manno-heptose-7-phosphate kinase
MQNLGPMDFEKLFNDFSSIKVGVIGDVMLDTYWWGHVDRISPEAPVPVVALDNKELRVGGAGNVALNLVSLQAQVSIFSAIGEDEDGKVLDDLFAKNNIDTSYLICSHKRKTTNKIRIISRNQQMMRLDNETTNYLTTDVEFALLERIKDYITKQKPAVIIFEDYNKGVLTENVITQTISFCQQHGVITTVDPKKKNFFSYKGVDVFKPNLKEVREGLNITLDTVNENTLQTVHLQLQQALSHHISFITLSEKGVFYGNETAANIIPSHIRQIADVSGAGDTVIAVASLVYAVTKNVALMAAMANVAGGLVCEEVGTMAINREKLLHECTKLI